MDAGPGRKYGWALEAGAEISSEGEISMRQTGILVALTCVCAMAISLRAGNFAEIQPGGVASRVKISGPPLRAQTAQVPQPRPEMQRLNFLIGTWDTESEYEKSTLMDGGKQKGWYKAQLGPGGFSVIADLEEDSPEGKDVGHEIISWDPKKKAYTVVVVGNGFSGVIVGTAKWEGDDLVILNDVGEGAEAAHLRAVYVHPQGNVLHIENYIKVGGTPFQLIYKATATKR
jgi:Protein of unknown function (DUF1579)